MWNVKKKKKGWMPVPEIYFISVECELAPIGLIFYCELSWRCLPYSVPSCLYLSTSDNAWAHNSARKLVTCHEINTPISQCCSSQKGGLFIMYPDFLFASLLWFEAPFLFCWRLMLRWWCLIPTVYCRIDLVTYCLDRSVVFLFPISCCPRKFWFEVCALSLTLVRDSGLIKVAWKKTRMAV